MNGTTTLGEVRAWLRRRVDDGVRCPACNQHAKVYRRNIHAAMARDLIIARGKAGDDWFHIRATLGHDGGDFAKLAYWGLIEEHDGIRDDGSTRSGWWRVTHLGAQFVYGTVRVPKYARVYNGQCLSLDNEPTIDIREALRGRFNYTELMSA